MDEYLDQVIWGNSVENYLWFTGIIVLSILFKRIISKKLSRVIFGVFKRFLSEVEAIDKFFELLIKPVEYLIVLIGISFAFNALSFPVPVEGETGFQEMLNLFLQVSIIIIVTWIVLRVVDFLAYVLGKQAEKTDTKADDQIIEFIKEALKIVAVTFSVLFTLGAVFQLNIGSLIAGLGIGGLAIALAAQDTLENLIASFIIFLDKPFVVGDYINVGDVYGTVEKIGFRSTRIRTLEKSYLTIPNKSLINDTLDNLTLRSYRRAKYSVGVTYDTSIDQIKSIVKEIQEYIDQHQQTDENGLVKFESFGDSSLNILVLYFVDTKQYSEYLTVQQEINYKIMEIVSKHGGDFAFPTRTVHVLNESK
ncbi:mechanosensitive ion channel family protein [Sphingobacteriaceae bacterium AH-315-L07]|nr:mechanosensitive ion channel family protein [Sphingobacteriaceae bacterium AH-315-L07]